MNGPASPARTSEVAAASDRPEQPGEAELADALHKVPATLADLRADPVPSELRERLALFRWLRSGLAAVELLLSDAHGRSAGTADTAGEAVSRA
jgi:hypothetical protein